MSERPQTTLHIISKTHNVPLHVFFLCGSVKEITYETSHLPPLKYCLIRACVIGQEPLSATIQSTQDMTLGSVLGYKY